MKTNTKKLLSVLLALMMMLSVVPFYASAEAVALTKDNIVEYPTVSGEIYFTQKIGDYLTLVGGKVTTDGTAEGTVVPGHFEFIDPEFVPTSDGENYADFKFIPDDADAYTGFEVDTGIDVIYMVNEVTMKFADPTAVPTATIVAGKRLTTADIEGIQMVCTLTGEVLTTAKWTWEKSSTKVEASGYFPAKITCKGYETINNVYVYVRIEGDTSAPPIEEFPTIDSVIYKDGLTVNDLEIKGGKANIPGSFAFADPDQALKGGTNAVAVVFTPEDTSIAPINITINVTVEKIPSTFIDENGNAIVPIVTLPFGYSSAAITEYFKNALANYQANCGEFSYNFFSDYKTVTGEYDCIAKITPKNTNYSNEISFKLIVEPIKILSVKYYGHTKSMDIKLSYQNAPGTYDVYVDGVLVGSGLNKYAYEGLECPYNAEVSGTHKIKLVYNKADANDTCSVDESEVEFTANAKRELSTEGLSSSLSVNGKIIYSSTHIYCGDEIDLECTMTDLFTGWEITDTDGNPVELEILTTVKIVDENGRVTFEKVAGDLSCEKIIFTMPDYDIIVKAKSTLDEEEKPGDDDNTDEPTDEPSGGLDDIFGDLTEGDSSNPIVNIFNNILAWFRNLIETIKNFFRGIGNVS